MKVKQKRFLFYFGHPAQYLFLRPVIKLIREQGHAVILAAKTKDVLTNLMDNDGEEFVNLLPEGRKGTRQGILYGLLQREIRLLKLVIRTKPDILIGSDPSLAHIGFLLRKKVITTVEDDYKVIKTLARITYPFTSTILTPEVCQVGPWSGKKIGYAGYMKLSYLHPAVFTPDPAKVTINKPFVMIRLASLTAHHDFGIRGLNISDVRVLLEKIKQYGFHVVISAEKYIKAEFAPYLLNITPNDIHHYLSEASLLISDSQSMSVEAAMLGTPSIRFSDFTGRISVLEELEKRYKLTFGIPTNEFRRVTGLTIEMLSTAGLKEIFRQRRDEMLNDKIRVGRFVAWFLMNYPESRMVMQIDPAFQYKVSFPEQQPRKALQLPVKQGRLDFTASIYRELMTSLAISRYTVVPFKAYIDNPLPVFVIVRQDVDARKYNSLEVARIQHTLGIKSTFYFRMIPQSYDPEVIDAIAAMGHEIGYHYEDMDFAYREVKRFFSFGKRVTREELFDRAIGLFEKHLARLRQHYPVTTICMHGSPMSPMDNRSLWKKYSYRDFGITGEPYFDINFSKVNYLTDTGRSWNGAKYSVRDKPYKVSLVIPTNQNQFASSRIMQVPLSTPDKREFNSTAEIINAIRSGTFYEQTMMTFHPQRWNSDPYQWTKEFVAQEVKNRIKKVYYVKEEEHF